MKSFRSTIDFVCVAAPKVVGGVCLVALNVSLMKWIGPDAYGIYSICLAALSLLSEGLFGAAIDMGVIRLAPIHLASNPIRALQIEQAALKLKLWIVGGLSLVLMLASIPLSKLLFHSDGDWYLIVLTCAAALGVLCFSSALLHFQIRGRFLRYGLLDAIQILIKFGGIAILVYCANRTNQPVRLGYVLIWFAVAPIFACGVFYFVSEISLRTLPGEVGHRSRRELFEYAKWFFCTLVVSSVIARIDIFALTALGSIDEVGLYAAGQTIASIPILLGTYLGVILSPKVMPYCRDGSFLPLLCRVQLVLGVLSVLGYAIVLYRGQYIADLLLPTSFAPSSRIIFILLPATLAGMTSFPLTVSFLMFVRPRFLVTVDLILLPFLLLAFALAIPRHGAIGAAAVTTAFGILKTCLAQTAAFRLATKSPSELGAIETHLSQQG